MAVAQKVSELKTSVEREAVVLAKAEEVRVLAIMEETKRLEVATMGASAAVTKAKQQASIDAVSAESLVARVMENADASCYSRMREADANKHLLTRDYLDLKSKVLGMRNTEVFWGDSIPRFLSSGEEDSAAFISELS